MTDTEFYDNGTVLAFKLRRAVNALRAIDNFTAEAYARNAGRKA